MGMLTEGQILAQSKKAQGETNQRLDALIAEQQQTNLLLGQLIQLLAAQRHGQPPVQPYQQQPGVAPRQVSWGTQQQR